MCCTLCGVTSPQPPQKYHDKCPLTIINAVQPPGPRAYLPLPPEPPPCPAAHHTALVAHQARSCAAAPGCVCCSAEPHVQSAARQAAAWLPQLPAGLHCQVSQTCCCGDCQKSPSVETNPIVIRSTYHKLCFRNPSPW